MAKQIRQTTPSKEYGHPGEDRLGAARRQHQGPVHCADRRALDPHGEGRLLKVLQLVEAVEAATGFLSLGRCKVETVERLWCLWDEMTSL